MPRRSKFKVGNVSLESGYGLESGSGLGSVLGLGCLELGLKSGYGWIGVEELVLELLGRRIRNAERMRRSLVLY